MEEGVRWKVVLRKRVISSIGVSSGKVPNGKYCQVKKGGNCRVERAVDFTAKRGLMNRFTNYTISAEKCSI